MVHRLHAGVARTPVVQASGWGPIVGDGGGLVTRLTQLLADGYRVVVAADGEGSAERLAACSATAASTCPSTACGTAT